MQSINPEINAIHQAYCDATGYKLPLVPFFERQWFEALKCGLTPDCVKLVIRERKQRIRAQARQPECLLLRNVVGSEAAICDVLQEAAAIRARMRVKVFPAGKAEVLRATGRPDEPDSLPARPIAEVIQEMRKAVG